MTFGDVRSYHSGLLRQANEAMRNHDMLRETFLRGAIHGLETVFPKMMAHHQGPPEAA